MAVRYKREGQKDCICLPQRCIPYDPAVIDVQVIDDGVYASYSGEEQYGTVAYIKEGEAYVFFTETLWSHYVEPLYETEGGAYLFYLGSTDEVKTVWYGAIDTAFDSLPKWNDDLAEQMIEIWRQTTEKEKIA